MPPPAFLPAAAVPLPLRQHRQTSTRSACRVPRRAAVVRCCSVPPVEANGAQQQQPDQTPTPLQPDTGKEDQPLQADASQPEVAEEEGPAEGVVAAESLPFSEGSLAQDDDGLQAALSKGWGDLSLFDHTDGAREPDVVNEPVTKVRVKKNSVDEEEDSKGEAKADPGAKQGSEGEVGGEPTADAQGTGVGSGAKDAAEEAKPGKRGRPAGSKAKKKPMKIFSATTKKTRKKKSDTGDEEEIELKTDLLDSEGWDESPRWYFVQVKPSCEQSCAVSIRNMSQTLDRMDILEVLVPSTKIMRLTKGGKSVAKEERFFPGYILVLIVMNRNTYSNILRVPNVQWFMGDPNRDKKKDQPFRPPMPVTDAEMRSVFDRIRNADATDPERKTTLRPGDCVRVTAGSFEGSEGNVIEVKPDLNVVKCNLVLFGRWSAVELEFDQLKVIEELTVLPKSRRPDKESAEDGADAKGQNSDPKSRRKRVEATVGDVDYSNAEVASAADDLAALLSDDASDKWNPEAIEPLPDDARILENKDADYDEFVSAVAIDNQKSESQKKSGKKDSKRRTDDLSDLFNGDGFISSDDELSRALANDESSDLWGTAEGKSAEDNFKDDDLEEIDFDKQKEVEKKREEPISLKEEDLDPDVENMLKDVFDDIDDVADFGELEDDGGFVGADADLGSGDEDVPLNEKEANRINRLHRMNDPNPEIFLGDKKGKFDIDADPFDFGDPAVEVSDEDKGPEVDAFVAPKEEDLLDVDAARIGAWRDTVREKKEAQRNFKDESATETRDTDVSASDNRENKSPPRSKARKVKSNS